MVTELKPELKKLPFEDFVSVMCRPMVSEAALREEVKEVFGLFAGAGNTAITAASLQEVMGSLDHPVSKLLVCPHRLHPPQRSLLRGPGELRRAEEGTAAAIVRRHQPAVEG